MTHTEIAAALRARIAELEMEVEACRKVLPLFEDYGAAATKARKAPTTTVKRSGEQRRPPSGGKGKSGRYADPETKARALKLLAEGKTVAQVAEAVGKTASAIYIWRAAAKKKSA